jgi:tetratricopeptide (TPR) repeat protein
MRPGGRHNLADLLMEKTPPDSEAARTQFEKSQELFQSLGDKAEVAGVENDVSVRLMQLCRYKEALASAEIAQQNWSAIGSAKEATALANMASMQLYLGDVRGAEINMKSALSKAQGKLSVDTNNWLITLGEIYTEEAKFKLAEQCFKGGPCYDDGQPPTVHGDKILLDAVLDYATLQIDRGQVADAEARAASALKSAEAEQDQDDEIEARNVLANALLAEGSDSALKRARVAVQAVGPFAAKGCRIEVALRLTMTRIAGRSGDIKKHDEELHQALQTANDLGLTRFVLEATLEQAASALRSGQKGMALQEANQVLNQSNDRGLFVLKTQALELLRRVGHAT